MEVNWQYFDLFFQEKMKAYSKNPWLVENIDDFNFWCCPECAYKSKDRTGNLMSVWLWWVLNLKSKILAKNQHNYSKEIIVFCEYNKWQKVTEFYFQIRFPMSKIDGIFLIIFSIQSINLGDHFFEPLYFLKSLYSQNFWPKTYLFRAHQYLWNFKTELTFGISTNFYNPFVGIEALCTVD